MNSKKILLLFFFIGLLLIQPYSAFSQQEDNVLIEGVIIDENNTPVPFVNVGNLRTNKGTASNNEGRFRVSMLQSDTLVFSSIGYQRYVFTLNKEIATRQLNITIHMNSSSLELEPVKVYAFKDEQALKRAILEMQIKDEPPSKIIIPGIQYGDMSKTKPNLKSPISLVQGVFSKSIKEEKKYAQVSKEYDSWQKNVYNKYNPIMVREVTGLPEDKVDDFMKFCEIGESFIRLSNEYEIVVAIQKCYNNYIKEGDEEPKVEN